MTGMFSTVVVIALIAIVLLLIGQYNRLVSLRNRFRNAYAQIDVQLKRRFDLIPNLVETAKGYLSHERGTLEAVIAARSVAVGASQRAAATPGEPGAMSALTEANQALSGSLSKLFALSEAYPDLKGNATMMQLSEELTSTENRVAFARQAFNDSVMAYNTGIEQFPAVLFAGALGFAPAALLTATQAEEERQPVKVRFG